MTAAQPEAVRQTIGEAQSLLRRGDSQGARTQLERAASEHRDSTDIWLNLAMVYRAQGDIDAALKALDTTLALDPYHFLALLSKGALLEQQGNVKQAAVVYRNTLQIAPPQEQVPPALKAPLQRAREVVDEQSGKFADFLRTELEASMGGREAASLKRIEESIDILAGRRKVYNAEPLLLHIPQLPAIPFFDRSYFPWLEELEAATDTIRAELRVLLDQDLPGFKPYIQYAPGTPENQFKALNHNTDWSSLWLWRDGAPQEEVIQRCPDTAAILSRLPMADLPGFAPTALFSALKPHTHIPPHTGSTNARLLVHLPLELPGPARFRVGNETRSWRIGEAWAFDDTIEHEAWNDADQTRVIMIFDVWNPLLSETERELITELLGAHRKWHDGEQRRQIP